MVEKLIEDMMRMSEMLGLKVNDQTMCKRIDIKPSQAVDLEELQVPDWVNDEADDAVEM